TQFDHCRLLKLEDHEKVKQREQETCDRGDHAEEQVGDIGRLAAISGLDQLETRFFLPDPFAEIETVDDGLDILFGRLPELGLLALLRHPLALALPDFFALERNSAHAF